LNILGRKLEAYYFDKKVSYHKRYGHPQPNSPIANVIITALTSGGLAANGKGSKGFVTPFCQELRRHGFATYICTSIDQLEKLVEGQKASIVVHLYGEDHVDIRSDRMAKVEAQAAVVFNSAEIGPVLADKQMSLEHFTKFGVPMPPPPVPGVPVFSNDRKGASREIAILESSDLLDESRYNRAMIDTVQTFEGRSYHTSVRLMCIADRVFNAMVRARPVVQNNPSVHTADTPLDPNLLSYLQKRLVEDHYQAYQDVATKMFNATGPCFAAHDILFDSKTAELLVCESGFKFFNKVFRDHLAPIQKDLPFHQVLFDQNTYANQAARVFIDWIEEQGIASSQSSAIQ
jgi:hypothetical protein